MLTQARVTASFVLVAFSLMMEGTADASPDSKLPDPIKAGVAEKLFRLDCGRSLANDEFVACRAFRLAIEERLRRGS